jgi:hypothetical protein
MGAVWRYLQECLRLDKDQMQELLGPADEEALRATVDADGSGTVSEREGILVCTLARAVLRGSEESEPFFAQPV